LTLEDGLIRIESPDPKEYLDIKLKGENIIIRQPNFDINKIKL